MLLQLVILLIAILFGVRFGGLALGLFGGAGLAFLAFFFHVPITSPPMDVILLIMAVVSASATMQASGGLDFLVELAEKMLKAKPEAITFLAPIIAYLLTMFAGTGHVAYALLPIISDVAKQTGIRPERPLSISVVASQLAISASPLSAATVTILALLADHHIELFDVLIICIPSTFIGIIIASIYANRMGCDLSADPICQAKLKDNSSQSFQSRNTKATYKRKHALLSISLFSLAIGLIIVFGAFPTLRPLSAVDSTLSKPIEMGPVIAIIMLTCGATILVLCRLTANQIANTPVFKAGIQAIIAIFGIAWLGDTFINHHITIIKETSAELLTIHPELFAMLIFCASILIYSQAATVRTIVPLGLLVGIKPAILVGLLPAANGLFVIPNYPTVIAAIEFDDTGSTRVGKYLLNHSFIIPGLIATSISVGCGFLFSYLWFS